MQSNQESLFDPIRAYEDHDISTVCHRLSNNDQFVTLLEKFFFPKISKYLPTATKMLTSFLLKKKLNRIQNVEAFQVLIAPLVKRVIDNTSLGLSISGLDQLDKNQNYTFISNHRDIVMDPTCIDYALYKNNFSLPYLAIGDNLLTQPFVEDLMRLNKSFIVKRHFQNNREKLFSLRTLSSYIYKLNGLNKNIWVAQAQGRAKDNHDKTDTALLKMLLLKYKSKSYTLSESIEKLNIVPVSISYEYDPCAELKARELLVRYNTGTYTKTKNEDLHSIATGIKGQKGHIHVAFGKKIDSNQVESIDQLAQIIDKQIYSMYQFFPINYLSWQTLKKMETPLTNSESLPTINIPSIDTHQINKFNIWMSGIPQALKNIILKMYIQPMLNQIKVKH